MEIIITVLAGFLLDLLFGDPRWLLHPIVLIGKLISGCEKILLKAAGGSRAGRLAGGAVLVAAVAAVSFAVPLLALKYIGYIDIRLRYALEIFWCWQIFAAKSLRKESTKVYEQIKKGDLEESRRSLSMIVGRDTQDLDLKQITKAVVETIAENASDGVIAPMLFMMAGGVPLGFLYKAVNTMDSMVGYKNEKYIYFGRAAARTDDVLNFLPARLTGLAMIAAALLTGLDYRNAARIFRRDRKNHASSNSGNPESACAGALDIQLGGDAFYFGRLYRKKTMGDGIREIEASDIPKANDLMYVASLLAIMLMTGIRLAAAFMG